MNHVLSQYQFIDPKDLDTFKDSYNITNIIPIEYTNFMLISYEEHVDGADDILRSILQIIE